MVKVVPDILARIVDQKKAQPRRVTPELEAAARQIIQAAPPPHRPARLERALSWPGVRALLHPVLLRQISARARREHYPAPYAMLDLWTKYGARGDAAMSAEARSFVALLQSDSAHNLIRVFLLQDRLKALAGKSMARLERVHVIGAFGGAAFVEDRCQEVLRHWCSLFRGAVGRWDLGGTSLADIVRSIRTKLLVHDDTATVVPGHGPTTTIGIERRFNPYLI